MTQEDYDNLKAKLNEAKIEVKKVEEEPKKEKEYSFGQIIGGFLICLVSALLMFTWCLFLPMVGSFYFLGWLK